MHPILALAGLGGLSSSEDFYFDLIILVAGIIRAMTMPILTYNHPPQWMIWTQPIIVVASLLAAHQTLSRPSASVKRKIAIYMATFFTAMFLTNIAGEARGIFSVASSVIQKAGLIGDGKGHPADPRP